MIVDLDPQGQCATALGLRQESAVFDLLTGRALRDCLRTTGRPNLYLVPGNKRTGTAQLVLATEHHGEIRVLKSIIDRNLPNGSPDFLIIDTAPSVGGLQEMALFAADLVLIPASTDIMSAEGITAVTTTLDRIDRTGWTGRVLGILPTFLDERTNESKTMLQDLRQIYGDLILDPIHQAVVLRECPAHSQSIFEYAPGSRAAEEYANLVFRVLEVTNGH
jgi:chromosome partitioning protein